MFLKLFEDFFDELKDEDLTGSADEVTVDGCDMFIQIDMKQYYTYYSIENGEDNVYFKPIKNKIDYILSQLTFISNFEFDTIRHKEYSLEVHDTINTDFDIDVYDNVFSYLKSIKKENSQEVCGGYFSLLYKITTKHISFNKFLFDFQMVYQKMYTLYDITLYKDKNDSEHRYIPTNTSFNNKIYMLDIYNYIFDSNDKIKEDEFNESIYNDYDLKKIINDTMTEIENNPSKYPFHLPGVYKELNIKLLSDNFKHSYRESRMSYSDKVELTMLTKTTVAINFQIDQKDFELDEIAETLLDFSRYLFMKMPPRMKSYLNLFVIYRMKTVPKRSDTKYLNNLMYHKNIGQGTYSFVSNNGNGRRNINNFFTFVDKYRNEMYVAFLDRKGLPGKQTYNLSGYMEWAKDYIPEQ